MIIPSLGEVGMWLWWKITGGGRTRGAGTHVYIETSPHPQRGR